MNRSVFSLVFLLLFTTSCSLFVDEYQVNSRKVIAYLLEDLPIPDDADIIKYPTVLFCLTKYLFATLLTSSRVTLFIFSPYFV